MPHAGDEDFGAEIVVVVNQPDIGDQLHSIKPVVIVAADERRDESRSGFGREQGLVGREAQRDVDHAAIAGQRLAGFEAIERQRHLDADIVGDFAQDGGLTHHPVIVGRDHFGTDRAIDNPADFLGHFLEIAPRLGNQRGIGGHPVEQADGGEVLDVGDFGGVGEKLHGGCAPACESADAIAR